VVTSWFETVDGQHEGLTTSQHGIMPAIGPV
jgi:hypothetical protein